MRLSLDPRVVEFFRCCSADIVFFARACLGWSPTEEQETWLRNSVHPENYNRSGNRWGKTESIAIKHLWKCGFRKRHSVYGSDLPYNSINCSITLDQAKLAISKAWRLLNRPAGERFRKCFVKHKRETPFPRIEFRNGAVFWARSTAKKGDYLHGWDYDYVSYDEAALDPYFAHVSDEVIAFRLADRAGQLDVISTGKRGSEFNRRFKNASEYRYCFQGSTLSNISNLDSVAVERLIAGLPERLIEERIYGGEASVDGILSSEKVLAAVARGNEALLPPIIGHRYSTGVDLGRKRSKTTILTLDITTLPYQIVALERFNQKDVGVSVEESFWGYVYGKVRARKQLYGGLLFVDATGLGDVVLDSIRDTGAEGIIMSPSMNVQLKTNLELAFDLAAIGMPLIESVDEYSRVWSFQDELESLEDDTSWGDNDASVALALGLWGVRESLKQPVIQVPNRMVSSSR